MFRDPLAGDSMCIQYKLQMHKFMKPFEVQIYETFEIGDNSALFQFASALL